MTDTQFEWRIFDLVSGEQHAGGNTSSVEEAEREAMHYTMMYAQDADVRGEILQHVISWTAKKRESR